MDGCGCGCAEVRWNACSREGRAAANALTAKSLHVGDGHAEDGELVGLAGEGGAGGNHVTELGDVRGHLVPATPLDLAVVLSAERRQWSRGTSRGHAPHR